MDFAYIWVGIAILSVVALLVTDIGFVTPRINKLPEEVQSAAYDSARKKLAVAVTIWSVLVGILGSIVGNLLLVYTTPLFLGVAFLVYVGIVATTQEDTTEVPTETYYREGLRLVGGMLLLAFLIGIFTIAFKADQAAEAKYGQTVTYHIDSTSRKINDGDVTAPISNLRTNSDGDTYSWLERQPDGTLQPRTVKRVNDGQYEVTIKDDLPATDTEARVERTVEYKVKSEDVNAGKEICDTTYSSSDPFINTLPKCEDSMTSARFQKAHTIIHIPAGSAEKMVPVTN